MIDRRAFLAGLVAGAAGLLLPDPERRVFALDRTMIRLKRDLEFYKTHPVEYFQDYGSMVTPYPVMATGPHLVIGDVPDNFIETGWYDVSSASFDKYSWRVVATFSGGRVVKTEDSEWFRGYAGVAVWSRDETKMAGAGI